jgi:import inner membrane translocase subunit TIM13
MSFLGGSSAPTGASQTQAIKQQVAQEAAVANARQLVEVTTTTSNYAFPPSISQYNRQTNTQTPTYQKLNEHCFERCIPKPGSSLSSGESTCYSQCMEKYMSAWNVVSKQYINRIQREAGSGGLMM